MSYLSGTAYQKRDSCNDIATHRTLSGFSHFFYSHHFTLFNVAQTSYTVSHRHYEHEVSLLSVDESSMLMVFDVEASELCFEH